MMNLRYAIELNPPPIPVDDGAHLIDDFEVNADPRSRWPMNVIESVVGQILTNQYMPRINEILEDYTREIEGQHLTVMETRHHGDRRAEDNLIRDMDTEYSNARSRLRTVGQEINSWRDFTMEAIQIRAREDIAAWTAARDQYHMRKRCRTSARFRMPTSLHHQMDPRVERFELIPHRSTMQQGDMGFEGDAGQIDDITKRDLNLREYDPTRPCPSVMSKIYPPREYIEWAGLEPIHQMRSIANQRDLYPVPEVGYGVQQIPAPSAGTVEGRQARRDGPNPRTNPSGASVQSSMGGGGPSQRGNPRTEVYNNADKKATSRGRPGSRSKRTHNHPIEVAEEEPQRTMIAIPALMTTSTHADQQRQHSSNKETDPAVSTAPYKLKASTDSLGCGHTEEMRLFRCQKQR